MLNFNVIKTEKSKELKELGELEADKRATQQKGKEKGERKKRKGKKERETCCIKDNP